ncbi:glycosyl transferase [Mucilaginibacter conchicola]|uniref:Glycosyl transferase n=1 Tax=Mucilaginibacter conchicola TaxID=2303333 RepID=A0A372P0A5_9SPHI|nr:glycosyl transferase [Mucilaginibacter conchicola]RFZ95601.1 glycosyl transferase [Mucilaginibacter conchicola]
MSVLGKIAYHVYHRPIGELRRIKKLGVFNAISISLARRQMASASLNLKEVADPNRPAFPIYILTGKKYWYQTSFCLYSLQKVSRSIQINAVLLDDGSFDDKLIRQIRSQFPGVSIQTAADLEKKMNDFLPVSRYPILRKKRETYPHIKKLTDAHAGESGWKMVIDSDMLFFKEPALLENWLKNPSAPFFLQDPQYAYYYTPDLMTSLAGEPIHANLNVGMVGLNSEGIDWDKLETWIAKLEASQGSNYLLEQALSAMLVAGKSIIVAPEKDYRVLPNKQEVLAPHAVLHHYVAESKEWYFKKAWQKLL